MAHPDVLIRLNGIMDGMSEFTKINGRMISDLSFQRAQQGLFQMLRKHWTRHVGPALVRIFSNDEGQNSIVHAELLTEVLIHAIDCRFRYRSERALHILAHEATLLRDQGCKVPMDFEAAKAEHSKRFDEKWNNALGNCSSHIEFEYDPNSGFSWSCLV